MNWSRALCIFLTGCLLMVASLSAGCLDDILPRIMEEKKQTEEFLPEKKPETAEKKEKIELPAGFIPLLVYFYEGKNNYLIPVTMVIPWTEGVARAALKILIQGLTPAQEMRYGLRSPLSPATRILGLTIREGIARVDFSSSFLDYDPERERLVLNSVIFTLLQFPTVDEVEIMVEGSIPESFPGGTPGKVPFGRERGINLEVADDVLGLQETAQVTVYYCTLLGEGDVFYVPVSRVVPVEGDINRLSVEELLKGPRPGTGLFSDLPPGTKLRHLSVKEGLAVVDLSRDILGYRGGLSGEENIYHQLILTLTDLPGVEKVQLLVEGEKSILSYGTSFLEPLPRPGLFNMLTLPDR